MRQPRKRTHKHMKPVVIGGKHFLEVYRKDPISKKTVYLRRHQSVKQCCKALKKRFPKEAASLSPSKLRLKRLKTKYPRRIQKIKYIGVTPVALDNGRTIWQVQKKFNTDSWQYDTQEKAARAVAQASGVTLMDIRHPKSRLPKLSRASFRAIHGPAMALYRKRKPGDLENLEAHAKKPRTWNYLKQYPGILPSFLIAKVATDRDNIIDSCATVASEIKKTKAVSLGEGEAYSHYSILVAAARKVCQYRWSETEQQNVGKNNFHWMNFHTMLQHLRILSRRKRKGNGSTSIVFCNSETRYYICAWNPTIEENLQNHIRWGRRCLSLCAQVPRTAEQFVFAFKTLDLKFGSFVGAQKDKGYARLWLKRAWMLFLLRAYKRNINFDKLPVRKFITCWPDQHALLFQLLSDEQLKVSENLNTPLAKALQKLKYKDKPELLSMHACLVNDHDAQSVLRRKGSNWIQKNTEELNKRMIAWRRRTGFWPHPGVFFPSCSDLK